MKKAKILLFIFTLIIVYFILSMFTKVEARYVLTKGVDIDYNTSDYYFNVDIDKSIVLTLPTTINLTVKNYEGDNFTDVDIEYTMSASDSTSLDITFGNATDTIIGGSKQEKLNTITIDKKANAVLPIEEDIELRIKSNKPYSEEKKIILKVRVYDTERYSKDGLVLMLDGENNTGIGHEYDSNIWKDLSGNNNDATLKNFEYTDTSGWIKNGMILDGVDDMATIDDSETMKPTNQTIEIIAQKDGVSQNTYDGREMLFVKWPGYTIEWNPNNTVSYGKHHVDYSLYLNSNKVLNLKTPYSITATYSSGVQKIYINGIFANSQEITPIEYGTVQTTIGNHSNNNFLLGKIYSIRMYDRELSTEEIQYNYSIDKERYKIP